MSAGLTAFQLAFQVSPIILVNGLVGSIPGGMLPVIALTEAINFPDGLLSGGSSINLLDFFAHYRPMPGSSLLDQDLGRYPFANQQVAANAVIQQPLTISMRMDIPVNKTLGYAAKLAIMELLVAALNQHNTSGGTYIVSTPAHIYIGCVLRSLRDASGGQSLQAQNAYQWDFEVPLLTLGAADQALNSLNNLISSALPIQGQPTAFGLASTLAQPLSTAAPSVLATGGSLGAGTIAAPGFLGPAVTSQVLTPLTTVSVT